jgi:hypothetical protein
MMKNLLSQYGMFTDGYSNRQLVFEPGSEGVAVRSIKSLLSLNQFTSALKILTGATGALGAHILAQLILRTRLHVVALVRAQNNEAAADRLFKNLEQRKLNTLDKTRFRAVAATLLADFWGLPEDVYCGLLADTRLIIHVSSMDTCPCRFAKTRQGGVACQFRLWTREL